MPSARASRCIFPTTARRCLIVLNLPGAHNVLNALAACAVGWQLGVPPEAMQRALEKFQGVGRRFQLRGDIALDKGTAMLVDDYGHHPRELAAVFAAARNGWPSRRLVVAFQPHRYTRTRDLLDDFANVLAEADVLVLTEVYPAGEAPIANADGRALARAVRARGKVDPVLVEHPRELRQALPPLLRDGDLLLLLGAGDIGAAANEIAASRSLAERRMMSARPNPESRIPNPGLFGRVAVVMGGQSAERDVSLDSGRNVLAALRAKGVDAHPVDGIPALLDALRAGHYARVFNILHGQHGGGEDGVLQGALESLRVPYTGSGVLGSALSMDKVRSKWVWLAQGLPTPRFVPLAQGRRRARGRSDDRIAGHRQACERRIQRRHHARIPRRRSRRRG